MIVNRLFGSSRKSWHQESREQHLIRYSIVNYRTPRNFSSLPNTYLNVIGDVASGILWHGLLQWMLTATRIAQRTHQQPRYQTYACYTFRNFASSVDKMMELSFCTHGEKVVLVHTQKPHWIKFGQRRELNNTNNTGLNSLSITFQANTLT